MSHAYSENSLVEQPAIHLCAEMGWQTVSVFEECGVGGTLGRETKGEAVLAPRLRAALERLNPSLPPKAISGAIDQLNRDRSVMSLPAANREVSDLLKEESPVSVPGTKREGTKLRHSVRSLRYQAANLCGTRDLLLPRLLSGQVKLNSKDAIA